MLQIVYFDRCQRIKTSNDMMILSLLLFMLQIVDLICISVQKNQHPSTRFDLVLVVCQMFFGHFRQNKVEMFMLTICR